MEIIKNYMGNKYKLSFKILTKYCNYKSENLDVAIYDFKINDIFQNDALGKIKIITLKNDSVKIFLEVYNELQEIEVQFEITEYEEQLLEEIAITNKLIEEKSKISLEKEIDSNIQVQIIYDKDFGYSIVGMNMFNTNYVKLLRRLNDPSNNNFIKENNLINKSIGLKNLIKLMN